MGPQWGGGLKFYKEINTEKSLKINTIKCLKWNAAPFLIDRLSMLLKHNFFVHRRIYPPYYFMIFCIFSASSNIEPLVF